MPEVAVERTERPNTLSLGLRARLFGVIGLASASIALAANSNPTPCGDVAKDLQSLDVTAHEFSVDAIDHVPSVADEVINDTEFTSDSAAPLLYLGPRVASILDAVFADDPELPAVEEGTAPRIAEDAPEPEMAPEKTAPVTVIDRDALVPGFKRHMYRKDI